MRRELAAARWLITGASGGIGRALAEALLAAEARVAVLARRGEELNTWRQRLGYGPERLLTIAGDVTIAGDRDTTLRTIEQHWGGLDGLINNAGQGALGPFAQSDPQTLRRLFEVNFFAAVELTHAALPLLQRGRSPIVVNIGSILGHRATPLNAEYCASKFALRGWSESVRAEFHALGIDLLLVSPGTTQSDFYQHTVGELHTPPWGINAPIPAAEVARDTLRAIVAGRREIIPSWRGKLLVWANRLAPGLVDRAMRRWGRVPDR